MNKKQIPNVFSLFKNSVVPVTKASKRIYTEALVLWLGVYQSLEFSSCRGSVEELFSERAYELFGDCARKRSGELSDNVGALIQARQQIKLASLQEALHALYRDIRSDHLWKGYRVLGIDGSTVSLNRSNAALRRAYPGGRDHKSISRWPIVHLVLMLDLLEGTIVSANLGAKYGKKAKSEQALTLELSDLIEEDTVVLGDRNFGTFNVVKELSDSGAEVLVRLTPSVAKLLAVGSKLCDGLDQKAVWTPSPEVRKKYGYEENERIAGRLIVTTVTHKNKTVILYLFTTLPTGDAVELAELYHKRWNIEEDIKSIKLQLHLKDIHAETKNAVEVELFCKLLAFNITRGMILLAVDGTDIDPRRISFTLAFLIVRTRLPEYAAQCNAKAKDRVLEEILERLRRAVIPPRPERSFKRQIYGKRSARYKIISSALKN